MNEIRELRNQIDKVDSAIIELINKRAELALRVKKLKLKNNIPILDKEREKNIIKMIKDKHNGLIKETDLEKLFAILLETMRGIDAS